MKQISLTLVDFSSSMSWLFPLFLDSIPLPMAMTAYYANSQIDALSKNFQDDHRAMVVFYLSDLDSETLHEATLIKTFFAVHPRNTGFVLMGAENDRLKSLIQGLPYALLHKCEPLQTLAHYFYRGYRESGVQSPLIRVARQPQLQPDLKEKVLLLNNKEREVIRGVLLGQTLSVIAKRSDVPLKTAASRKYSAMRKLGINGKLDLSLLRPEWF